MKFGTLYSYWGTKWQCDYLKTLKRVSDIGFDILEMGAPHLLEMSDYELSELRRAAKDMDMVLTAISDRQKIKILLLLIRIYEKRE